MATRTTKAEPELYLCLLAARDDREYQEALGNFFRAVRLQDVEVSARYYVNDAVGGGGGLSGEFGIIASAIGPAVCAARGRIPCGTIRAESAVENRIGWRSRSRSADGETNRKADEGGGKASKGKGQ